MKTLRRATFVIVAASGPVGEAADVLYSGSGAAVGYRLSGELLEDLRFRNGEGILTDNYAPVENLIAPVFLRSVE